MEDLPLPGVSSCPACARLAPQHGRTAAVRRRAGAIPLLYGRIEGRYGRIDVPFLGTRIGEVTHWLATRRSENGPESAFYNLHISLKWMNEALFNDTEYVKKVVLRIGKGGVEYEVKPVEGPGQRTALSGASLVMDRVRLDKVSG